MVLESASDNTSDYPSEEFEDVTNEDRTAQGENDVDGGDESMGDHGEGDRAYDEEGHVERVNLKGPKYREGDE